MHENISKVTSGITISVADIASSDSPKYLTAFRRYRRKKKKDNRPNGKLGTAKSKESNGLSSTKKRNKKPASPSLFTLGLAEVVGTGLLLFLGCMGCITVVDNVPIPHHLPGLTFGLAVMLIIQTFGHISGAHLNPAVTLATVLLGMLKPVTAVVYVVAQFAGALLGFGLLKALVPLEFFENEHFNELTNETLHTPGVCTTVPYAKTSVSQALALETIITSVLILVCCAVWDKRNSANSDSVPLRFGLIITCIGMAAGPYTGASMNTVRSFAPALFNWDWDAHWIYWVGPNLGAVLGAGFYKSFLSQPEEDDDNESIESTPLTVINNSEKTAV